jgi:hypothetical protein
MLKNLPLKVSKQILPLVFNLSYENLEGYSVIRETSPDRRARNFSNYKEQLIREGHPAITKVKRVIKQNKSRRFSKRSSITC